MTVYPIQGIPVAPGQLPPLRYECKDWSKNHEESIQVSLFIRALQKFYDLKYDEDLSYFRVAGKSSKAPTFMHLSAQSHIDGI